MRSLSDTNIDAADHKEPAPLELWEFDPSIMEYKLQQSSEEPHKTEMVAVTREKIESDVIVKSSITVTVCM